MYTVYQGQVLSSLRTSTVESLLQLSSQSTQQAFIPLLEGVLDSWKNEFISLSGSTDPIEGLLTAISMQLEAEKSSEARILLKSSWKHSRFYRLHYIHNLVYSHSQLQTERMASQLKGLLLTLKASNFRFDTLLDLISFVEQNLKDSGRQVVNVRIVFDELVESGFLEEDDRSLFAKHIGLYQGKGSSHFTINEAIQALIVRITEDSYLTVIDREINVHALNSFSERHGDFEQTYGKFYLESDYHYAVERISEAEPWTIPTRQELRAQQENSTPHTGGAVAMVSPDMEVAAEPRVTSLGGGARMPSRETPAASLRGSAMRLPGVGSAAESTVTSRGGGARMPSREIVAASAAPLMDPARSEKYYLGALSSEQEEMLKFYRFSHLRGFARDPDEEALFLRLECIEEDSRYLDEDPKRRQCLNAFKKILLIGAHTTHLMPRPSSIYSFIIASFERYRFHPMIPSFKRTLDGMFNRLGLTLP